MCVHTCECRSFKVNKSNARICCSSTFSYIFIKYSLNSLLRLEEVLIIVDLICFQVCLEKNIFYF
jgi:hypothetical protein